MHIAKSIAADTQLLKMQKNDLMEFLYTRMSDGMTTHATSLYQRVGL